MKVMFQQQVIPRLKTLGIVERVTIHRKINLFGRGESDIESQALDLTARGRVPEVGITAHEGTISFRISASAATEDEARLEIEPTARLIYEGYAGLIVGEGSEDVPDAVFKLLERTGTSLATAESCTGGLIAHMITAIPGVSPYYLGGASYANQAKIDLLGVPAALIERMERLAPKWPRRWRRGRDGGLGADIGLSSTGVAGPAGGTAEKPVGLVYIRPGHQSRHRNPPARYRSGTAAGYHPAASSKSALNWVRLTLTEDRRAKT